MTNPTGKGIRSDKAGSGLFAAPRGARTHLGEDRLCVPGQEVLSPISGRVTRVVRAYADDARWTGVEIVGEQYICKLLYVEPGPGIVGQQVLQGDVIGKAQDITVRYHGQGMLPHVHMEININPSLYVRDQ
jgi:hypothetical protein